MHRSFGAVAEEPLLAQLGEEEEVFSDATLISFANLNGPSFDEASTFQSSHSMTCEVSGVPGLHLKGKFTGSKADA